MSFHSPQFFLFFPLVLFLYFSSPARYRNALLLAASAWFYMAWRPEYILLIVFSVGIDYFVANAMPSASPAVRRALLGISLASNLGLLFFYKYFTFVAGALRSLGAGIHVDVPLSAWEILLPVGISFYTFQALSYTIDVYRGDIAPERNIFRIFLYVLFFPQLVAGPIERSSSLLPQFNEVHEFDYDRAVSGFRLALWGLVKKVAIADRLGVVADAVYAHPSDYGGAVLIVGTYAFAFQIYADFSAYSDIAIGVARILGFRLMKNFDRPYYAVSPTDFWRRWHVSLSTWFRDYVYIPLGGNRGGRGRWLTALLATFVLSGLWHGAGWTFLLWGALHGILVVVTRLLGKATAFRLPAPLAVLLTFHLVLIGWIFFRAAGLGDAAYILTHLVADWSKIDFLLDRQFELVLCGLGVAALLVADLPGPLRERPWPAPARWAAYAAGTLLLLNARVAGDTSFIYFQF